MSVQITIRNVPDQVRDELAARAQREGKSMEEYLRGQLARIASRPTIEEWVRETRERKRAAGTRVSAEQILESRDADRR
jgi:hypothetical protein